MFSIEMVDLLIGKFEVVMGRRWNCGREIGLFSNALEVEVTLRKN
jgi:hypothetical protein